MFGCLSYTYVNEGKLQIRTKKCVFLGYLDGVKCYRLWDSEKCSNSRNSTLVENGTYDNNMSNIIIVNNEVPTIIEVKAFFKRSYFKSNCTCIRCAGSNKWN